MPGYASDFPYPEYGYIHRYTHANCANVIVTNATTGNFQLWPYLDVITWDAIGISLSWLFFRKMELDF